LAASPEGAVLLAVRQIGPGPSGGGRTAILTADTTWHWVLAGEGPAGADQHARLWRRLTLWAAGRDEQPKGDLSVVTDRLRYVLSDPDQPPSVRITVSAKAASGLRPQGFGGVGSAEAAHAEGEGAVETPTLQVTEPNGQVRPVPLGAASEGTWRGAVEPTAPGTYRLRAETAVGAECRSAESEFLVVEQDFEMADLLADPDALREIAEAGGGSARRLEDLGGLLGDLAGRTGPVFEPTERRLPLASGRIFLVLVLALLSADWFLRRRWNLA